MINVKKTKADLVNELKQSRQRIIDLENKNKSIEEKLNNSEKLSLAWLENSPICTKIIDLDLNLQYMSAAGIKALEINDIATYYGKPYPLYFYPQSFKNLMRKSLQKTIESREIVTVEDAVNGKNGEELWFHSTLVPINNDDGELDYIMAVSIDVTKRKQLEQQLQQSQKMEAIGVLTGGIAHEFNNLLSPILGYAEMLLMEVSDNDTHKSYLERIYLAGNKSKVLVQQMLAYGRQSISKRELIKLDAIVDEVLNLIQNTIPSNVSIKKEIEANLPEIWGTPNEIHQILLNLCINASDAIKKEGIITITLKKIKPSEVANSNNKFQKDDLILLSVNDSGEGITKHVLERIFDPFFTTKNIGKGSGLGLSVAQGIVEQHGGVIEVKSEVGKGSTFNVYFPISQKIVNSSVKKTESLSQRDERILLVDDSDTVLFLTKHMLKKLGYRVTIFADCIEALEHFKQHSKDFDLVITDYGMPHMNGKEFATKIKEIRHDIPIILYTGYGNLVAKDDISSWHINDLLIKPCSLQDLSDVVKSVLEVNKVPARS
jgi:PAS domain S-box-containing protein